MKAEKIDFSRTKNWGYLVETIIILVGVILRLKLYLYNPSFFIDECALGVNIIERTYSDLFLPLHIVQCAPPFFLVVSKFILDISHQYGNIYTQDLVLRAFTQFCSIMSLPLFAIFLNKISNNKLFVWTCLAMLSLNTCAINYSVQFKQYSCELMVGLILLLIFYSFDIKKLPIKTLSIYSFLICVSIWFSNTAFVLLATGFMYFILKCFSSNFRKEIKSNFLKTCIIAILVIINLISYYCFYFKGVYYSYLNEHMHNFWEYALPSFFCFKNFLALFPLKLQGLIEIPCLLHKDVNVFVLFSILIFFFAKTGLNFKAKFFTFTPILLAVLASFFHIYPFERRLILFSLPLFIILYSQFVFLIKPNMLFKRLTIVILAILSVWDLSIPIDSIYYPHFKQPFRETAEFILRNKIPETKIVLTSYEIEYYMRPITKNFKDLSIDIYWKGFENSIIHLFVKKIPKDDFYIFIPMGGVFPDYYFSLMNYLNNDNHLKVLNAYKKDEFIYIIHIKKIANYK